MNYHQTNNEVVFIEVKRNEQSAESMIEQFFGPMPQADPWDVNHDFIDETPAPEMFDNKFWRVESNGHVIRRNDKATPESTGKCVTMIGSLCDPENGPSEHEFYVATPTLYVLDDKYFVLRDELYS